MNELEAKCYLTKQGGANNSDHTCIFTSSSASQAVAAHTAHAPRAHHGR